MQSARYPYSFIFRKATLSSIPAYFISLFKISKVVKMIESLHKIYLWESRNHKKDHLIKWKMACNPKESELGMGNISLIDCRDSSLKNRTFGITCLYSSMEQTPMVETVTQQSISKPPYFRKISFLFMSL